MDRRGRGGKKGREEGREGNIFVSLILKEGSRGWGIEMHYAAIIKTPRGLG